MSEQRAHRAGGAGGESAGPVRPRLRPGTRVVTRPDGSLQVGGPGRGVLLLDLSPAEAALVAALDGTRSRGEVEADAAVVGIPPRRSGALLDSLAAHGLLEPAAAPRVRRVLVDGGGPAGAAVQDLLEAAGVRVLTGPDASLARGPRPGATVLLRSDTVDARDAAPLLGRGLPHLPVVVSAGSVVVGPLVVPGTDGPCLRCCDLARSDRDPGWPAVHAQLLPRGIGAVEPVTGGPTLDGLAASLTTMVLLAHLDGHDDRRGVSHEVHLPWPRVVARQWVAHPSCPCPAGRALAPARRSAARRVTMAG